jgi:sugar phosphate isomerase/epimerase
MAKFILSAFADEAGDSLSEQIAALKENEIRLIEPRSFDKRNVITLSNEELLSIREALDEAGIKVGSLGSPIGKFSIDEDFDAQLEKLERALCACEILGANKMRMFSFYMPSENRAEHIDAIAERLCKMVSIATDRGVTLCHENEEKIYGEAPEHVSELFNRVPSLMGVYDPANFCVCGHDPEQGLLATLPRLAYVHIKDGLMKGAEGTEDGMVILPAGEGDGRLSQMLNTLDAYSDGEIMLTLEPHLFESNAFLGVDDRTLASSLKFDNARSAFDHGVSALKKLLVNCGFRYENGYFVR